MGEGGLAEGKGTEVAEVDKGGVDFWERDVVRLDFAATDALAETSLSGGRTDVRRRSMFASAAGRATGSQSYWRTPSFVYT